MLHEKICETATSEAGRRAVAVCMLMVASSPTLDTQCTLDTDCPPAKACISGQCKDPCGQPDACGERALCQSKAHMAVCSCPQCYVGKPQVACHRDPACIADMVHSCRWDSDCEDELACDKEKATCYDPCTHGSAVCEDNKTCEVRKHRPICICKFGFMVNSVGEFVCAPGPVECQLDDGCPRDLACINRRCVDPCLFHQPCPPNKQCQVMNHQPVCFCLKDCTPSISICLNDEGCAPTEACVSYQCVDPCTSHGCLGDSPCYVEDHKPLCKFCPPGFTVDPKIGCVKGKAPSWVPRSPSCCYLCINPTERWWTLVAVVCS